MRFIFGKNNLSDYELSANDKAYIYDIYNNDNLTKLHRVSILVFLGEIIIMILDIANKFFQDNPINYLNLAAEIMLISVSIIFYLAVAYLKSHKYTNKHTYKIISDIYKLVIVIAILCFIFTDIYVRQKTLGAYLVFMFILQITPYYKPLENFALYFLIALFTIISYTFTVKMSGNTLFSTLFIFVAFYLSSEYLRFYYISQLVSQQRVKISNMRFQNLASQTIKALSDTVEAKDNYTNGHSMRVAKYAMEISKRLGDSEERQREVYYIGLMHDVGKIGVPDTVINKKGHLTDEEYEEIKKHPVIGYDILKRITELPAICEGAKWHHERYDGKGYPDGLKGEEIPLIARIVAVADAYDAMTSNRSYRKELPQSVVRQEIEKNIGTQFSPEIAKIMLEMIDEDISYNMRETG